MTFQMQLDLAVCTSPFNRCTALRPSNHCVLFFSSFFLSLCFDVIMFIESLKKKRVIEKQNDHQVALRPNYWCV